MNGGNVQRVYSPRASLEAASSMLARLDRCIDHVVCASRERKDFWASEIKRLKERPSCETMIGLCGATGAGKSSLLNALLKSDIVPTSGMQACTAAVIEIRYHQSSQIKADISFIPEEDYRTDLTLLLEDIKDGEASGSRGRRSDKDDPVQSAWAKVHALYPDLSKEEAAKMSADDILTLQPDIIQLLGGTKTLMSADTQAFVRALSTFVCSKSPNSRRVRQQGSGSTNYGPSFWPIVNKVSIWCQADVLSTGAVLVDLPGLADANSARRSVTNQYMSQCDRIWIVSPVTRAMNDKTIEDILDTEFATQLILDGHNADSIAFVLTKCDDVKCSEIIESLELYDEDDLIKIDELTTKCDQEAEEWEDKKDEARKNLDECVKRRDELACRLPPCRNDSQSCLSTPTIGEKRRRSPVPSDENFVKRMKYPGSLSIPGGSSSTSRPSAGISPNTQPGPRVPQPLGDASQRLEMQRYRDALNQVRSRCQEYENEINEAQLLLNKVRDGKHRVEMRRKAFCSLRRSEECRFAMQRSFKEWIEDLAGTHSDQAASGSKVRVFTISSREYIKMNGRGRKIDGPPDCFTELEETGIPELARFCHTLALPAMREAAAYLFASLRTLNTSISDCIMDHELDQAERERMQERWQSRPRIQRFRSSQWSMVARPHGIAERLLTAFSVQIQDIHQRVKVIYQEGLEATLRANADQGAHDALRKLEEIAKITHWQTYRATLRRYGVFKRNLNMDILSSLLKSVMMAWYNLFRTDFFADFEQRAIDTIKGLLAEIEGDAPENLKAITRARTLTCLDIAIKSLGQTLVDIVISLRKQKREVSRKLAPHMRDLLLPGYRQALAANGRGSGDRQKAVFHDYIRDHCSDIFVRSSSLLSNNLNDIAEALRVTLEESMDKLAKEIEVNVGLLWEQQKGGPYEIHLQIQSIDEDIADWERAAGLWIKQQCGQSTS